MEELIQLSAVRSGDVIRVAGVLLRVLSARPDAGSVILELGDKTGHPMTLVGVPEMSVRRQPAQATGQS